MSKQDLGVVLVPACGIGPLAAHLRRVPITTTWVATSLSLLQAQPRGRAAEPSCYLLLARLETRLLGLTGNLPATAWALCHFTRGPGRPRGLSNRAAVHVERFRTTPSSDAGTPLCVRFYLQKSRSGAVVHLRDESGNRKIPYRPTPYTEYTDCISFLQEKNRNRNREKTETKSERGYFRPYSQISYIHRKISAVFVEFVHTKLSIRPTAYCPLGHPPTPRVQRPTAHLHCQR